ncbi:MAG: hypothetical protein WCC06_06825 [Candidatus Aminicenantales bacterium]
MGNKRKFLFCLFLSLFLLFISSTIITAEDTATQRVVMRVNPICIIRASNNPQPLVINPPIPGGELPPNAIDNTTYLQYSSTVALGQTRTITAHWNPSDSSPAGCELFLQAVPSGSPNEGVSNGEILLSSFPHVLVRDIRSCATGTGSQNGARLMYRLSVVNLEELNAGESRQATIIFTLTDGF